MLTKLHKFTEHRIVRILLVILAVSLVFCAVDLWHVARMYTKPRFCLPLITADDGGSGIYIGLLYGFSLDGHLPAIDETEYFWVVEQFRFFFLGIPLLRG